MSVYITNKMITELYKHAERALRLSRGKNVRREINNVLAIADWMECEHFKQNKKITARVNKMRKINKHYGRPKPKEA